MHVVFFAFSALIPPLFLLLSMAVVFFWLVAGGQALAAGSGGAWRWSGFTRVYVLRASVGLGQKWRQLQIAMSCVSTTATGANRHMAVDVYLPGGGSSQT
jgi:hypothetical protein